MMQNLAAPEKSDLREKDEDDDQPDYRLRNRAEGRRERKMIDDKNAQPKDEAEHQGEDEQPKKVHALKTHTASAQFRM